MKSNFESNGELKRKGSSDKNAAFLSKLHEISNEHVDSNFKNTNDLISALADFASPAMKDRILDSSPSGRRKTISMNKELFEQIADLLSKPIPIKLRLPEKQVSASSKYRKLLLVDMTENMEINLREDYTSKRKMPPSSGG